jgi:hypothetical protein
VCGGGGGGYTEHNDELIYLVTVALVAPALAVVQRVSRQEHHSCADLRLFALHDEIIPAMYCRGETKGEEVKQHSE